MKKQVKAQEKAINEVIKKFGDKIDLKKSPFLLVEIAQHFNDILKPGVIVAQCAPPGGPPKKGNDVILVSDVLKEITKLKTTINQLHKKIDAMQK